MMPPVRISPSILSADFARLGEEVRAIDAAGCDWVHIDVMDGHFVPNITIGPMVVKALRPHTTKPLDVHLMISPVDSFLDAFAQAGADIITVHPEAGPHIHRSIQHIKSLGKKAGVSLNPGTPAKMLDYLIDDIDLVLVMSVNPGFGGQSFLDSQLRKIEAVRKMIDKSGRDIALEVDGGIDARTAPLAIAAGADTLVAGTATFRGGPSAYAVNIEALRRIMSAKPRRSPVPQPPPEEDGIEQGKRLIRLGDERGASLTERLANHFYRMTWRTPLHSMRLKGKYPLKLLAAPDDPIPGDARAGTAIRAGHFTHRGYRQALEGIDYTRLEQPSAFQNYLHSFRWLRDLAAAATRGQAIPIAEAQMRAWMAAHGEAPAEPAWRVDNAAWRILFWTAYSPLILSSGDLVYRSLVLNCIARTARHLDRSADKAPIGLPRVVAWAGIIAAGLLLPGGEPRRAFGEAGLKRALEQAFYADGGLISRSPIGQIEAIALLSMLRAVYATRKEEPPPALTQSLEKMVAALLGVLHGDGSPGSWQGGAPIDPAYVSAVIAASGVRTRPLRQARDWGYQRLSAGQSILIVDAAPPPVSRLAESGCASTAAFELSDGPHRVIINCGGAAMVGAALPADLAFGLRTTAAHSALVLDDSNSTAILSDGTLGRGVGEVELDRQEIEQGSRLEIAHDGYARRLGLMHRRILLLSSDGRELRGEDVLLPAERRRKPGDCPIAIRFHLGPDIEPTLTADKQGALLRLGTGGMWQFRVGEGEIAIEDSLWVDGEGRPRPSVQIVVNARAGAGGASIGWLLKKSG